MRIGLISCSKEKLDHVAPAKDLYTGPLFKLSKAWMLTRHDRKLGPIHEWAILSAKHGLVLPSHELEPYDLCLGELPKLKQDRWRDWVNEQLMQQWGESVVYMILAGADYRSCLRGMPMIEDVISSWTQERKEQGMAGRRAVMSIGIIKRYLKHNTSFAGFCPPEKNGRQVKL